METGRERPPFCGAWVAPPPSRGVAHAPASVSVRPCCRPAMAVSLRPAIPPEMRRASLRHVAGTPARNQSPTFVREVRMSLIKPRTRGKQMVRSSRGSTARTTRRCTRTRSSSVSRSSTCSTSWSTQCWPRTRTLSHGAPTIGSRACLAPRVADAERDRRARRNVSAPPGHCQTDRPPGHPELSARRRRCEPCCMPSSRCARCWQ